MVVVFPFLLTLSLLAGSLVAGWSQPVRVERVELKAGYAAARNDSNQPTGFGLVPVAPGVAVPLTDTTGPAWLRGRIVWAPELYLGSFTYPYGRPFYGANPLQFRYEVETAGRWTPYVQGTLGLFYANINRPETGDDFNYQLSSGIGTRYSLNDSASLILEYRHLHVSNADSHEDNSAIEAHTFLAGVSLKI